MPNTKVQRREVQEPSRRAKLLSEKSSSFHGRLPSTMQTDKELRRPKTLPDVLHDRSFFSQSPESKPKKLTKLLLNITIQGSVGAVHVIMSPENTVADLVIAAVKQYVKECRRPILPTADSSSFDLHYSQFCLESKHHKTKFTHPNLYKLIRFGERGKADGFGIEELLVMSEKARERRWKQRNDVVFLVFKGGRKGQ